MRAALESLSQLRTHLTSALTGLKAAPPECVRAVLARTGSSQQEEAPSPPQGAESFGYSSRKHRWGVITKGERFGTLVVRLEAPAAPASNLMASSQRIQFPGLPPTSSPPSSPKASSLLLQVGSPRGGSGAGGGGACGAGLGGCGRLRPSSAYAGSWRQGGSGGGGVPEGYPGGPAAFDLSVGRPAAAAARLRPEEAPHIQIHCPTPVRVSGSAAASGLASDSPASWPSPPIQRPVTYNGRPPSSSSSSSPRRGLSFGGVAAPSPHASHRGVSERIPSRTR